MPKIKINIIVFSNCEQNFIQFVSWDAVTNLMLECSIGHIDCLTLKSMDCTSFNYCGMLQYLIFYTHFLEGFYSSLAQYQIYRAAFSNNLLPQIPITFKYCYGVAALAEEQSPESTHKTTSAYDMVIML